MAPPLLACSRSQFGMTKQARPSQNLLQLPALFEVEQQIPGEVCRDLPCLPGQPLSALCQGFVIISAKHSECRRVTGVLGGQRGGTSAGSVSRRPKSFCCGITLLGDLVRADSRGQAEACTRSHHASHQGSSLLGWVLGGGKWEH